MAGVPVADLGHQLNRMLLSGLVAVLLVGLLAGLAAAALTARRVRLSPTALRGSAVGFVESGPRRFLRISLGVLWIIDGLLQAQPAMPGGFVSQVIDPGIGSGPSWLANLISPLARSWTHHPVAADAATVWIQVGVGALILLNVRPGPLRLLVLWTSVLWAGFVWVTGEFLGGLLQPGASWLAGSPGAVLVYAAMALLLLADRGASTADLARRCRWVAGGWLLAGAFLQALPWENNWSAEGLAGPFRLAVQHRQPALLLAPIRRMLSLALDYPLQVNLILICLLLLAGTGLLISADRAFLVLGLLVCAGTWWLAQDFGVIGGYGTDPNAALPLAALLWAGRSSPMPELAPPDRPVPVGGRVRLASRVALEAAGITSLLAIPLLLGASMLQPADANAVLADSGGGVTMLDGRPAPEFSLPDQHDQLVSMASTAGELRLVTFLDPVCSDDCPVIANQIAAAVRGLGSLARRVQVIAIDSNPLFYRVSDVAAFSTSHGLDDLPNWHFVAGSQRSLQMVLDSYGIVVQVPAVGMIAHSEGIYFIDGAGRQLAYLADGANPDLQAGYTSTISAEIRKLLP